MSTEPHEVKYNAAMQREKISRWFLGMLLLVVTSGELHEQTGPTAKAPRQLPNGKLLGEVPGNPRATNNFPTAAAVSPDGRFAVLLHSGYGAYTSGEKQSLTVLNLETNELRDFPDERLAHDAKQSYFLGLAFSVDGKHLYASMASLSDALGKGKGNTGNGIAVYGFEKGIVKPQRFLSLASRKEVPRGKLRRAAFKDVTYPAGLSAG